MKCFYVSSLKNKTYLSRKSTEKRKPKMTQGEGEVLVEEVPEEFTHTEVRPATVNQQQPLQKPKLSQGEVAGKNRLHSFLTTDSYAYVSRCNHDNMKHISMISLKTVRTLEYHQ